MKNKNTSFKILVLGLLILATILLIAALGLTKTKKNFVTNQGDPAPTPVKMKKTDLPESSLPDQLPANLPIEAKAKITENFKSELSDGRLQSTRTFVTNKTLEENFKLYSEFFKKDGWEQTASLDQQDYKMLAGKKENNSINIELKTNSKTGEKTVSVSVTQHNTK